MSLQNFKEEIKQFLEDFKEHMGNSPSTKWLEDFNLDYNIDKDFDLEDSTGQIIEYWNESVAELLRKFNEEFDNPWKDGENPEFGKGVSKIHDAAYDFNSQYVSPNPNLNSEKYEDNRTDEIESVLQNSEHLDYTIGEVNEKLKKYITRLIMPQYQRRVEVEDLNRNFWVIGQNLSLLNKLVLDLDGPLVKTIKGLISEITGLWENVYRVWQAILHISGKIDSIEDDINKLGRAAAKTKIQLAYSTSWGNAYGAYTHEDVIDRLYKSHDTMELELTDTFLFKEGDGRFFGLLPYIEKESVIYNKNGDTGYLFYLPYNKTINNKRLNKYTDEQLDKMFIKNLSPGPSGTGEIIGIDRKFGNTPARELLQMVQAKNFVLVSPQPKGAIPTLDALTIVHNPILSALQFYRDFLYSVINLDNNKPFGDLIENTFTWLQGGYLEYINFTESRQWKDSDIIPEDIFNCYDFLKKFTKISSVFSDSLESINSAGLTKIEHLKNLLLESQSLDTLIPDFYQIYEKCVEYLKNNNFIFTLTAPYFTDNYNGVYEIDSTHNPELFCQEFKLMCEEYNEKFSIDSKDTFSYIPTIYLFPRRKSWFEGYNFGIDGTYKKLIVSNYSDPQIQNILSSSYNSNINWDLLSNTLSDGNFRSSEVINQDYPFLMDRVSGASEEDKKTFIKENVINSCLADLEYSGWFLEDRSDCVCNSFLYDRVETFGVWFDFIADPINQGATAVSGEINSFTLNEPSIKVSFSNNSEMLSYSTVWSPQHIYNVDITIPFSNIGLRPYFDFIRLGKPYPSITQIIDNRAKNGVHLDALNDENNYISYNGLLSGQVGDEGFCIDGYYGFESLNNYPIGPVPTLAPIKYEYNFNLTYDNDNNNKAVANMDVLRKRSDNNKEIHYYGGVFFDNVKYQVASTDLINAYLTGNGTEQRGGVSEGFTKIKNRNEINNPVINFSYLSSSADPQEVSILVSKDTTVGKYGRIIEPNYAICEVVKIGDIYPESINNVNYFKANAPGYDQGYTTGTYGVGSYHVEDYQAITSGNVNCKFVSYYDLSNGNLVQLSREQLTEDKIKELGIKYIEKLYSGITSPVLVATKMGITYWTGSHGSQWDSGIVADLFQAIPQENNEKPKVIFLTKIWRKDGYWDDNLDKSAFSEPYGGTKWRHLDIRADEKSIIVTEQNGQTVVNGTGAITWYDRNIKGTASYVGNTVNSESKKRGAWVIDSNNLQERVVAYCNFNINNNNFSIVKPEYYRLVGEQSFLGTLNDIIFNDYGEIPNEWNLYSERFTFN